MLGQYNSAAPRCFINAWLRTSDSIALWDRTTAESVHISTGIGVGFHALPEMPNLPGVGTLLCDMGRRISIRKRGASVIAAIIVGATLSGCASTAGPDVLTIDAGQYAATFDAAVEAAREEGLTAALRDRRAGVIETQTRVAGSILEPWRLDNASFGQSLEHTVGLQRRRVRFEFAPAGFIGMPAPGGAATDRSTTVAEQDPLVIADRDLTTGAGDLELRVWVYVERASSPGERRSTWTRHASTRARSGYTFDVAAMRDDPVGGTGTTWTTVARDSAYERRLLAAVSKSIVTK